MTQHLSFSQITSWLSCGEQYRLSRIEGWAETPAWWFVSGKAIHAATEDIDRNGWANDGDLPGLWEHHFRREIADTEAVSDVNRDEWRSSRKQGYDFWLTKGVEHLNNWLTWKRESGWTVLPEFVEVPVEGTFGIVEVRGYIDRIVVNPDGELVVLDLKSGAMTPKFAMQLAMYARMLDDADALDGLAGITRGAWFMTGRGQLVEADLTGFTRDVITIFTEGVAKAKEVGLYLPNPGIFCGNCGVKEHCRVGSLLVEPPPKPQTRLKPIRAKGGNHEDQ